MCCNWCFHLCTISHFRINIYHICNINGIWCFLWFTNNILLIITLYYIKCSWKKGFGIDCLTCGFQRSLELLFEGELLGSFVLFPALIPFVITVFTLVLHLTFKFKNGAKVIIFLFSLTVLLILVNYTIKLSQYGLFH